MEKSKLEKFITKYNLGGSCEEVIFNSDGNMLSVRVISGDKNVVGEVSLKNIKFPEGEFAVHETKKLRAINDYNLKDGTCNIQLLGPIIKDPYGMEKDSNLFDTLGPNQYIVNDEVIEEAEE